MRPLAAAVSLSLLLGCNNFDALVERCVVEGRCGEQGGGGGQGSTAPPTLVAQPGSLSFTLAATDLAPTQRVLLQNVDGGAAESLAVALGGVNDDDFRVTNACGTTLSVGQGCSLDVTFQPASRTLGVRDAVLEVRASQGEVVLVPLTGTLTSALTVQEVLDFGDVTVNTQKVLPLMVRNLSTTAVALVPSVASPFTVQQNGCASVGPMQTCAVQLLFESASPGPREETLELSAIGTGALQNVRLLARAVTPGVLQLEPSPLWPVNTAVLFPSTSTTTFTLRNTGAQLLSGLSLAVVPADAGVSILDAGACDELAAGASCTGLLLFQAATVGSYSIELMVDGGTAGGARAPATVHALRDFDLSVQVSVPADAGAVVMPDGGLCTANCSHRARHDPRLVAPQASLAFQRSDRYDFGAWGGDCGGSGPCVVTLTAARFVSASFQRVPTAFITNISYPGNFGGLDAGDTICAALAQDAGLPGNYIVFLGVPDAGAFSRVPSTQRGWLGVDGRVLTRARMDPQMGVAPLTARGAAPGNPQFYTGMGPDGGLAMTNTAGLTATCSNWSVSGSPGADTNLGAFGTYTVLPWWSSTSGYRTYGDHCSSKSLLCFDSAASGAPLPHNRDAGVTLFVATRTSSPGDGGFEFFDPTCDAGARALGLSSGYALITLSAASASSRVPTTETRPVFNLNGTLLYSSAQALRGTTAPLAAVSIGLLLDGGVGLPPSNEVATGGQSFTTTNGSDCSNYTVGIGTSGYFGNLSASNLWWRDSSSTRSCTTTPQIYCLAFP